LEEEKIKKKNWN